MSSMVARRYISVDVANPRGGYQKPFVVIPPIPNHENGHYVRPNKVACKYPNFKKNVDPNSHVRMFNSTIKENV
jgi:hypothetical protein